MMQTSGENVLSTRKSKIVVMIVVVCIVGFLIVDGPAHANGSVRSFIGQRTDQVSTDILNGNLVTNPAEFSSVVGITGIPNGRTSADEFHCTGVLLSRTDVLTAGHCCDGAYGFKVHTGLRLHQRTFTVRSVTIMPGYNYDETTNSQGQTLYTPEKDLCAVMLDEAVNFAPEQIYISHLKPPSGTVVDIVGFGRIAHATLSGMRLYAARTTVTSCTNALSWARNRANVINDIVCAGHGATTTRVAQNACVGDSGGPLLSRRLPKGGRNLYGILSDGNKPCEPGKNSYTDVTKKNFTEFIERYSPFATWMPICNT